MGLAETLGARAARQGRSAPVECGGLGTVTVEAFPVRELELLLRGSDGARAVFYAACRELQSAGEELRKAGKVFTPDGIMQFVSDDEAAAAARTVLELSGEVPDRLDKSDQADSGEARLAPVRQAERDLPPVRPAPVHTDADTQEIRPASAQKDEAPAPGFEQVLRGVEAASVEFDAVPKSDKNAQEVVDFPPEGTQNAVSGESTPIGADDAAGAPGDALLETESEFRYGLYETTSEFLARTSEAMHETTSKFPPQTLDAVHETKPEFGEIRRDAPHEIKLESGEAAHETTSDFQQGLHEMTSEFAPKDRSALHETTSELAEDVARRLVEGLRRAKWVRGD